MTFQVFREFRVSVSFVARAKASLSSLARESISIANHSGINANVHTDPPDGTLSPV